MTNLLSTDQSRATMPSCWVDRRGERWIVRFRTGGREAPKLYGGSFRRRADADTRRRFIDGELAALRVPNIHALATTRAPTVLEACDAWRAGRVDVTEATRTLHRVALKRVTDLIGSRRLDEITPATVASLVGTLSERGAKRETIKKSVNYLGMVLDSQGMTGERNAARDRVTVRLPRERRAHIPPPLAEHVETVASLVPREYVLPFLILDWAGPRVRELETATLADLDEQRHAIRIRPEHEKNDRFRYLDLPDDLWSALMATLPPREDRDPDAPIFPGLTDANLRMAIKRACTAGGVPHFSPHGLRRRRGSLHYKRTGSLAEVAELLGDSKRVASEHYVYALTDHREAGRQPALARLFT
jgi:integrase